MRLLASASAPRASRCCGRLVDGRQQAGSLAVQPGTIGLHGGLSRPGRQQGTPGGPTKGTAGTLAAARSARRSQPARSRASAFRDRARRAHPRAHGHRPGPADASGTAARTARPARASAIRRPRACPRAPSPGPASVSAQAGISPGTAAGCQRQRCLRGLWQRAVAGADRRPHRAVLGREHVEHPVAVAVRGKRGQR